MQSRERKRECGQSSPTSRSDYRWIVRASLESGRLKLLALALFLILLFIPGGLEAQEPPRGEPSIEEGARYALQGAGVPVLMDLSPLVPGDRWLVTVRSPDLSQGHDECLGNEMGEWHLVPEAEYDRHDFDDRFTHVLYASEDCSFDSYRFVLYWLAPTGENRHQTYSSESGIWEVMPAFALQSQLSVSADSSAPSVNGRREHNPLEHSGRHSDQSIRGGCIGRRTLEDRPRRS